MQLHQTAAQGLSLYLLVTVIQIDLHCILATNKPHYSPGLCKFVNIFPGRGTQRRGRLLIIFPKTLNFKHLTEHKDISKDVSTYPSHCNNEYTDFN